MNWVLRPSSIIRRSGDGTLWTAGHPGHPGGDEWWFWRLHKSLIGWTVDKAEVWHFAKWPAQAEVVRA